MTTITPEIVTPVIVGDDEYTTADGSVTASWKTQVRNGNILEEGYYSIKVPIAGDATPEQMDAALGVLTNVLKPRVYAELHLEVENDDKGFIQIKALPPSVAGPTVTTYAPGAPGAAPAAGQGGADWRILGADAEGNQVKVSTGNKKDGSKYFYVTDGKKDSKGFNRKAGLQASDNLATITLERALKLIADREAWCASQGQPW